MTTTYVNQCRLCLNNEPIYPIFDKKDDSLGVYFKLRCCIKETVEDTEGLPRAICGSCHSTLDVVYNFLEKCKATFKILNSSLPFVEVEKAVDLEKCVSQIKIENETYYNDDDHENYDSLSNDEHKIVIKVEEPQKIPKNKEALQKLFKKLPNITVKKKSTDIQESKEPEIIPIPEKRPIETNSTKNKKLLKSNGKLKRNGEEQQQPLRRNEVLETQKSKLLKIISKVKPSNIPEQAHVRRTNIEPAPRKPELPKKTETHIKPTSKDIAPKEPHKYNRLCEQCGESFDCSEKFAHHRRTHTVTSIHECPMCNKQYSSHYQLRKHKAAAHSERYKYICDHCDSHFYYAKNLASHISKSHPTIARQKPVFNCASCDKVYKSSQMLRIHISRHHKTEDPEEEIPIAKW